MFKLFHNEGKKIKIADKVFMYRKSKWNYCQNLLSENPGTIFIGWFDETIAELENHLTTSTDNTILNARTIHKAQVEGSTIIFIEHHPIKSKEEKVFDQLGLVEAVVLTALDEPLMTIFGGDRLIKIMQGLDMKEDEIIEHKMVSQSIANAQEKIEKKITVEQSARSQSEWIERNLK